MTRQVQTRIPARLRHAILVVLATMWAAFPITGAQAQGVDLAGLSPTDRGFIQQMLETERSNVARELPASNNVVTITRTETQPRICRYFVIQMTGGGQQQGVGCRVDSGVWELGPSLTQLAQTGAPAAATISDGPRVEGTIGIAPSGGSAGAGSATVSSLEIRDDPTTWQDIPVPQRRPGTAGTTVTASAAPSVSDTASDPAASGTTAIDASAVDPSIFIRNAPSAGGGQSADGAPFDPPLPRHRPGDLAGTALAIAAESGAPVEAQGDADIDDGTALAGAAETPAADDAAVPSVTAGPALDGTGGPGDAGAGDAVTLTASIATAQPLPANLTGVPLPGRRPQ